MSAEIIIEEYFKQAAKECKIIPIKPYVASNKTKYITHKREERVREGRPITEFEMDFCVALWRGVVMQAIYDISASTDAYEKKILKADSYSWFSSEDFALVCELAMMNPNRILDLVRLIRCGRVKVLDSKTFKIKRI